MGLTLASLLRCVCLWLDISLSRESCAIVLAALLNDRSDRSQCFVLDHDYSTLPRVSSRP